MYSNFLIFDNLFISVFLIFESYIFFYFNFIINLCVFTPNIYLKNAYTETLSNIKI